MVCNSVIGITTGCEIDLTFVLVKEINNNVI
jgi:hypothetical protein